MNPVDILSKTLVEYPKNPARGELVKLIKRTGSDDYGWAQASDDDFTLDNSCLCLLGHVGAAGGAPLKALIRGYDPLYDENGIENSIRFLWEAIVGSPAAPLRTVRSLKDDVYSFNDRTLNDGVVHSYHPQFDNTRPDVEQFTPESVAKVTEKIQVALDLAKAAAAKQAILDAETTFNEAILVRDDESPIEDSNAVKVLLDTAVNYPKNPTTGLLIFRYKDSEGDHPLFDDQDINVTIENSCACLLGQVGLSGGVKPAAIIRKGYRALHDENGIEEAIALLAQVIDEESYKHALKSYDPKSAVESVVYRFNDGTLDADRTVEVKAGEKERFTSKSILAVVAKINEAVDLGRAKAVKAREEAKAQAQVDALQAAQDAINAAKALLA